MGNTEVTDESRESDARDRPSWLAVVTGLNTSIAVSYLACKPPQTHTLSLKARLFTSALYILITCLAGTLGTWIALSRDSRKQFRSLVLWGARGWVFLPAIMMFLREGSVWALFVAVLSATLMAVSLSRLTVASEGANPHQDVEKDIFITQLCFEPVSWLSFGVSLCLYGALMSAVAGRLAFVTLLLGAAAFLLVSQLIAALAKPVCEEYPDKISHPISLITIAFCCAFVALSAAAGISGFALKMRDFYMPGQALASTGPTKKHRPEKYSSEGYQAIVLWPIQKKEKVIPSPPLSIDASSRRMTRPWVIPFYGPYLYFKIPGESPGPDARTTHGDPLKVNVHSTDHGPLLMEAHQNLSDPIDMNCCREIQVVFRNDVLVGASDVGISLTDSHSAGKVSQNLGIKYVALDDAGQRLGNTSTIEETLSFPFPKTGKIKKFDLITVILFPDVRHSTAGRKVAVERFVMIPK